MTLGGFLLVWLGVLVVGVGFLALICPRHEDITRKWDETREPGDWP